jgi:hypothetical protein
MEENLRKTSFFFVPLIISMIVREIAVITYHIMDEYNRAFDVPYLMVNMLTSLSQLTKVIIFIVTIQWSIKNELKKDAFYHKNTLD